MRQTVCMPSPQWVPWVFLHMDSSISAATLPPDSLYFISFPYIFNSDYSFQVFKYLHTTEKHRDKRCYLLVYSSEYKLQDLYFEEAGKWGRWSDFYFSGFFFLKQNKEHEEMRKCISPCLCWESHCQQASDTINGCTSNLTQDLEDGL